MQAWLTLNDWSWNVGVVEKNVIVSGSMGLGEVVGKPIPTFMSMNATAKAAAEAALFEFDYMPNTYNFARETYDYPHDTYDYYSEPNSVVHEQSGLNAHNTDDQVEPNEGALSETQGTNEQILNLVGGPNCSLNFKKAEGQIEALGRHWPDVEMDHHEDSNDPSFLYHEESNNPGILSDSPMPDLQDEVSIAIVNEETSGKNLLAIPEDTYDKP